MRRRNGTRYDRMRYYKARRDAITYGKGTWRRWCKRITVQQVRAQVRDALAHTALDDDWDIVVTRPIERTHHWVGVKNWRKHSSRPHLRTRYPQLAIDQVRRLPSHLQHQWRENERPENQHEYRSILRGPDPAPKYVDYQKTLEILKSLAYGSKWRYVDEKVFWTTVWRGGNYPHEGAYWQHLPAVTLLDKWFRALPARSYYWQRSGQPSRYQIAEYLKELGYNVFTTDEARAAPPEEDHV